MSLASAARRVPRVAILGAGREGVELTLLCVRAGVPVTVEDVFPDKLRSLRARLSDQLGAGAAMVQFAESVEDAVRAAEIVMDSVPDELESKLEIFSLVDRMALPGSVLCSPLREVGISDLAACTSRPEDCVGVRTNDAGNGWLACTSITLLRGRRTSDAAINMATDLWAALGKQVTVHEDGGESLNS